MQRQDNGAAPISAAPARSVGIKPAQNPPWGLTWVARGVQRLFAAVSGAARQYWRCASVLALFFILSSRCESPPSFASLRLMLAPCRRPVPPNAPSLFSSLHVNDASLPPRVYLNEPGRRGISRAREKRRKP